MKDYSAIALQWCNDIVSGKIPSCQKVVQACRRHLSDLQKQSDPNYPYRFDEKLANNRCKFSEKLPHTKGKWRGSKLTLSPYQIFFRTCVWGWVKKKDGMRRFRTAVVFLPRKQGKSVDGADTGLFMLVADNEPGAEVYCLDAKTKILTKKLEWVDLGNLSEGDEIIAFDEEPIEFRKHRRFRETTIVSYSKVKLPSYKINFKDGRSVVCSSLHKWLGKTPGSKSYLWKETEKIKSGFLVANFGAPWEVENSWEAGYLAGVYDGEGWIRTTNKVSFSGVRDRHGYSIGFTQNPGDILDKVSSLIKERNFNVSLTRNANGVNRSICQSFEIKGSYSCLRFLGQIRPNRLAKTGMNRFMGMTVCKYNDCVEVDTIEFLGERELIAVETGTKTILAEGFLSHNSGAKTEKQALEVFRPAWQMVEMTPAFKSHFGVSLSGTPKNPTSIYRLSDMSRFELVIGKPPDGASPSCAIIDEYHQHATSDQRDALRTGMGARSQPLLFIITTAGTDTSLPCYDEYLYALKVLDGSREDDTYFALIFAKDDDQDEKDFETWKMINPNYGISIDEDFLKGAYNEAMTMVSKQNINYCRHLNLWSNAGTAWMNMTKWAACCDPTLKLSDFIGQPCYAALDLASKIDICALVLLFEGKERTIKRMLVNPESGEEEEKEVTQKDFIVFGKYYLPEETIQLAGNDHYIKWVKEGYITETPGARTDFLYIENDLKIINKDHPIQELAFDPREASYLISNVSEWLGSHTVDGEEVSRCVEITQGPQLMSEPMKETEGRIYSQTLWFDGDPVFTWQMGNVVKKQGRNSGPVKYYYPTKERSEFKIDVVVALIMAVSRAMKSVESGSVFDGLSQEDIRRRLRGEI